MPAAKTILLRFVSAARRRRWLSLGAASAIVSALFAVALSAEQRHPLDVVYARATGVDPAPAPPLTVLRRMSLQLRGSIPKLSELEEFELAPEDARLRFAVVFLRDPAFAAYWGSYFAALLRDRTREKNSAYGVLQRYLSEAIHENKGYDQIVRELITASGSPDQNPAAAFYIRDDGDPLQVAEYAGRLFYGRRVQCARCHDHPYEADFKRRDYYGLASFFSQNYVSKDRDRAWEEFTGRQRLPRDVIEHLDEQARKDYQEQERRYNREIWARLSEAEKKRRRDAARLNYRTVFYEPALGLRYPTSDAEAGGDLVAPKYPDGTRASLPAGADRREAFARWLTAPENARFRKVIINRIWHRLMGWSFFEPFDDWNANTAVRAPELLDHLDGVFLEKGYRVKDLALYIVTSDAYARSSPPPDSTAQANPLQFFPAQRMNPDQLMNALIRGAQAGKVSDIRERGTLAASASADGLEIDLRGIGSLRQPVQGNRELSSAAQIERPADYRSFLAVFGAGPRIDIDDDDPTLTIEQILTLMNGRLTGRLAWESAGADTLFKAEYDRRGNMASVYNLAFRSVLSRDWSEQEKARILELTEVRSARPTYNRAAVQDLLWSLFNSQEFQHVY